MLPKPYIIRGNNYAESCVAKIYYGQGEDAPFVIAKCKRLSGTLKNIEDGLNAYYRGGKNNPNGIYFHLYEYCKENPDEAFRVEILLESDSGYQLLKEEQIQLDAGRGNPLFLNNQLEAYIPAFDEATGMYGWLTKQDVLLFKKYMKTRKKRKPKSAKDAR